MPESIRYALQQRYVRVAVSLAGLIILATALLRQIVFEQSKGIDFVSTYAAALAIRGGQNPYVEATAWAAGYTAGSPLEGGYFYTPTFASLLSPLTVLPYDAALAVWMMCIAALLCIAIYTLLRSGNGGASLLELVLLAAGASLMSSVRTELIAGNANLFMAACVCASIWQRQARRPRVAGVLLALAVATKPMLLVVVAFLLWKREFKFALTSIAGFAALSVLPFLWLGQEALTDILGFWRFYSTQYLSFEGNIAPRGVLERLFNVNPYVTPVILAPTMATVIWVLIAGAVLLLTLAAVAPRPIRRDGRTLVELGLIISALLVISPLTETTYLVFLIIPFTTSFMFLRDSQVLRGLELAAACVALLALWAFEALPRGLVEAFFTVQAPSRTYLLIAAFAVELYLAGRAAGIRPHEAAIEIVRNCPQLASEWLRDFASAVLPTRCPSRDSLERAGKLS